jgi:ATP-dependent Clp protease protease subunit
MTLNPLGRPTPYAAQFSPQARYILPQFEERTSYGMKRLDPYTKLFEDRIIFLGVQVDDASADDVIAQLIVLESQDPDRDILMYINSPGGSFTAMTAIYDTMQYIRPTCRPSSSGRPPRPPPCCSAPAPRASASPCRTRGCSSTSRPSKAPEAWPPTWRSTPTRSSGCAAGSRTPSPTTPGAILRAGPEDIERDKILSAEAAKEYGLIDEVLASRNEPRR